jgi:arabinan endo-1,5-alpha-L-arabinosidase
MKSFAGTLVALLTAMAALLVATETAAAALYYTNPVLPNTADPGVVRRDDQVILVTDQGGPHFYMVRTVGGVPAFGIWESRNLVNWSFTGRYVLRQTPPWAQARNLWAPEIHRMANGKFVAYYTIRHDNGKLAIGAAVADTITGNYTDIGRPLITGANVGMPNVGVIDPHANVWNGRSYLYFKSDGNAVGQKSWIFGAELDSTGISVRNAQRLIKNDRAWEGSVVEAPWVKLRGGLYHLMYSANAYYNSTYTIAYATSRSPIKGFVKKGRILRSNSKWYGPGHNSTVGMPSGRDYIIYHAFRGPGTLSSANPRGMMVEKIVWKGVVPTVGNGTPAVGRLPYPT